MKDKNNAEIGGYMNKVMDTPADDFDRAMTDKGGRDDEISAMINRTYDQRAALRYVEQGRQKKPSGNVARLFRKAYKAIVFVDVILFGLVAAFLLAALLSVCFGWKPASVAAEPTETVGAERAAESPVTIYVPIRNATLQTPEILPTEAAAATEPQETETEAETELEALEATDAAAQEEETEQPEEEFIPDEVDVQMLAKLIWGEARGVGSKDVQAAVAWCVLNRVDNDYFPDTVAEVITQDGQFMGYGINFPVEDEFREIAEDVLVRWHREQQGETDVGRTLPSGYLYFTGDGVILFARGWHDTDYFDWSLPSPYEMGDE